MSCFVMNPEPLAAIANAVETRLNCDYNYWGFSAPDSLYRELADCKTSCTYFAEEIYKKLYAVNVRAYNGRYMSHEEPVDEEAPAIDVDNYTVHRRPEYRRVCRLLSTIWAISSPLPTRINSSRARVMAVYSTPRANSEGGTSLRARITARYSLPWALWTVTA